MSKQFPILLAHRRRVASAFLLAALFVAPVAAAPTIVEAQPDCATSRAVATIESVGQAMIGWLADQVSRAAAAPPSDGGLCPDSPAADVSQVPPIEVEDLRALLVPLYIASIPASDPWGRAYEYRLSTEPSAAHWTAIRSAGRDGQFESNVYEIGNTGGPDEDLVFFDSAWARRPPRRDPVSRQLVTLGELRVVGSAWISWYTDAVSRAAGAVRPAGALPPVDFSALPPLARAELADLLVPTYLACLPAEDGWGRPFDFRMNPNLLATSVMAARSGGSDAVFEGDVYSASGFPPDELFRDLVWSDGFVYRAPEGERSGVFADDFETGELWGTWTCGPGY
ncbi:MAG: hypothetical protein U0X73_14645 [Thermoanaerobaculia bacterium]